LAYAWDAMKHTPLTCETCGESLTTIDYKVWGSKRFNPMTGNYDEDDTMGNADMEFSCPKCSAKLEPVEAMF